MSCVASSPTETLFGTSTSTSRGTSTITSVETVTTASTVLVTSSSCVSTIFALPSGTDVVDPVGECASYTTTVGTLIIDMTTTVPHTTLTTVTAFVPVTQATQTLFACVSTQPPSPPVDPPVNPPSFTTTTTTPAPPPVDDDSTLSTPPPTTIVVTVTTTDAHGSLTTSESSTVSQPPPSLVPIDRSSGTPKSLPAILGGVLGGVAALLLVLGAIWYILYRRRRGRHWDDIWEKEGNDGFEDEFESKRSSTPAGLVLAGGGTNSNSAARGGGRKRFNLEDDDSDREQPAVSRANTPYEYGVVGGLGGGRRSTTPSGGLNNYPPSDQPTPRHHVHTPSGVSDGGYAGHGRTTSHTPLMSAASPPLSPVDAGGRQRSPPPTTGYPTRGAASPGSPVWASRAAQEAAYFGGHPAGGGGGSGSTSYPPGAAPPATFFASTSSSHPPPSSSNANVLSRGTGSMRKPPLEASLSNVTRPLPPHQPPIASSSSSGPPLIIDAPNDEDDENDEILQAVLNTSRAQAREAGVVLDPPPTRGGRKAREAAAAREGGADLNVLGGPASPISPVVGNGNEAGGQRFAFPTRTRTEEEGVVRVARDAGATAVAGEGIPPPAYSR